MTDASGNSKIVNEKFDEAINKFKETGKEYGFKVCEVGKEITTTQIEEGDGNKCPTGMEIGSFHIHPVIKDAIPSTADINKS